MTKDEETGGTGGTLPPVPPTLPINPKTWVSLDSVATPEPQATHETKTSHPFDAHAHWQVWVLSLGMLAVLALSIAGWWQAASGGLVLLMLLVSGWRIANRHSWIRARGTAFDVTVLVLTAIAIAGLVIFFWLGGH